MKKILSILLIIATALSASALTGCAGNSNFVIAETSYGKTLVCVTDSGAQKAKLKIPSGIEHIGQGAFLPSVLSLVELNIPKSVKTIGDAAFPCLNLEKVIFAENSTLEYIGDEAFSGCSSLREITIPEGAAFGENVFSGCNEVVIYLKSETPAPQVNSFDSVKAVFVPEGKAGAYKESYITVKNKIFESGNISGNGFVFNTDTPETLELYIGKDKNPAVPASFTVLGANCFKNNTMINTVSMGEAVTLIGADSFSGCINLTKIDISVAVREIGNNAFYSCKRLTEVVFDGDSKLNSIGSASFQACYSLSSFTVPDSVATIGGNAFMNCKTLTKVIFGGNSHLNSIGSYAFSSCSSLSSFNIPGGVTNIGDDAFNTCVALAEITVPHSVVTMGNSVFGNSIQRIHVKGYTSRPAGWSVFWAPNVYNGAPNYDYSYPKVVWNA